ncbi:hypothetical protein K4L44_03355 [Halosquirtibacter laminarini]|uniref:Uncharacterized protein n=1 Tax=Halosquirtibacter laminarini TaxID=3374600 RepID=A0AC61NNL3_9BACT|nr:hypothetical protein K4L44_03355 [Prolixibacteraceae bacterium]
MDKNSKMKEELKKKSRPNDSLESFNHDLSKCLPLYQKLIKKCTPNQYKDPQLKEKAQDLFNELMKSKYNYSALEKIEKEVGVCFG